MNFTKLSRATTPFRTKRKTFAALGVSAVMIAAVACSGGGTGATATAGVDIAPATRIATTGGGPAIGAPAPVGEPSVIDFAPSSLGVATSRAGFVESASGFAAGQFTAAAGQQAGIWIDGIGSLDIAPDIATLSLGVESREATVGAAREAAAIATQSVIDAAQAQGVLEDDIRTTSFRISPQTVYREVRDSGGSYSQPEIVGYIVSNQLSITIRDLDRVGDVVDSAAAEAGDLVRINGVSFGVDNPSQYAVALRQMASADALGKAQIYADSMGVGLGPLMFLTETGSSAPQIAFDIAESAPVAASFAKVAPTPFMPGDSTLTTRIQAVFAIVG